MFSIITPTYNRADTLSRVYDSLKSQTFRNFHWIIVDDASIDDTAKLVSNWQSEDNFFKIDYYKLEENRGKPFALNFGFEYCDQPITVIADSDDSFVENSFEDLSRIWNEIDNTLNASNVASVWTLTKDENGAIVGEKFPKNFWQVSFKDRVLDRWPVRGEKWHSWRTEILKSQQMYYNKNAAYVSESATWRSINLKYDFLCVNLVHRTYWYSESGLIHEKKTDLKRAKIKYYTAYYQLKDTRSLDILTKKYYQLLGFELVKSYFFYWPKDCILIWYKLMICIFCFLKITIKRIFKV